MTQALGLTLHNLLNIRVSPANKWQGTDPTGTNTEFVTFLNDSWGIRAACRLIILHQDRLGKGTANIPELIKIWAPESDGNNTEQYIQNVCAWGGFQIDQEYDFNQYDPMFRLIRAQIQMEVGIPNYNKLVIDEGLKLAGVQIPLVPATKSPAFQVATVTAVLGASTPVIQQATTLVSTASPILLSLAHVAPYVVGAILVLGAVYLVIHEMQKRKVAV